jgi:CheY-like chemotaxis protein
MSPALSLSRDFHGNVLFHVRADKYKVPRVRDFYRTMATNLATGIRVPLYPTQTVKEIEHFMEKKEVSVIFMGQEEYEENPLFFDNLSKGNIVVAVSAAQGFKPNPGSGVLVMPKPLYAYPVIKVINEGRNAGDLSDSVHSTRPVFEGLRALVVDDEPMNLIVATGLFKEYKMIIDTADSGMEALDKFDRNEYDVIFMDHMMPQMDGVEAMKRIRSAAERDGKKVAIVALTANAVSGAKEMFLREGFDGFISKPIIISDFERVMQRVVTEGKAGNRGGKR